MPDPLPHLPLLVLAGGSSRRMGRDKATLPWRGRPLLLHVLDRLAPIATTVVVAARPGQELPPGAYRRVDDRRPGEGPLAGLAAGLAIAGGGEPVAVAVVACDYPFADPALWAALLAAAPGATAAVPFAGGRAHPLAAVWRADAAAACDRSLERGERRVRGVLDAIGAVEVDLEGVAGLDPARALLNVNDAEALARARREAP